MFGMWSLDILHTWIKKNYVVKRLIIFIKIFAVMWKYFIWKINISGSFAIPKHFGNNQKGHCIIIWIPQNVLNPYIDHMKIWRFSKSSTKPFNNEILNTNMHIHFCCWRPTSEGKMLLCKNSIVLKSSHITQVQCNNCNVQMFYGCCRFTITTL